jgi:putative transposase
VANGDRGHLRVGIQFALCGVSANLISTVTDSVLEDVVEWQNRPLEPMYAVVFFDALRVKIRDEGTIKNKAVYLALGIHRDGTKEVLGI